MNHMDACLGFSLQEKGVSRYGPSWPRTHYGAQAGLELATTPLPLPPERWNQSRATTLSKDYLLTSAKTLGTGTPQQKKKGAAGSLVFPARGAWPCPPRHGSPVGIGVHHLGAHLLDAGPAAHDLPASLSGEFFFQLLNPLPQPLHRLGHGWAPGSRRCQPGPPPPPPHAAPLGPRCAAFRIPTTGKEPPGIPVRHVSATPASLPARRFR